MQVMRTTRDYAFSCVITRSCVLVIISLLEVSDYYLVEVGCVFTGVLYHKEGVVPSREVIDQTICLYCSPFLRLF